MPVKRSDDGHRSIEVEVEVPGTPEAVWKAIATAAGISAWFVPTTSEDDADGNPQVMTASFGPGMDSVSKVTGWDPPHKMTAESEDLGPDAPPIATQWIVETRSGDTCVVRVVHSLFSSSDEWDKQLEGWESGWPSFFKLLRLYLAHFSGEPCAAFQLMAFHGGPSNEAWRTLMDGLGVRADAITRGGVIGSSGDAPCFSGTIEDVGAGANPHPEEFLLRVESPVPGIAHFFAMEMGGQVILSIRFYLYGADAERGAAEAKPEWEKWLGELFPAPTE